MRILHTVSRFLLNAPYMVRLNIVVLPFLLCLVLLVFRFPSPYDGSLFAIPVALAAWIFKQRGMFICVGGVLLVVGITYDTRSAGLGSQSLVTVFLIGALALLTVGLVIAYLRTALDLTEAAQLKALRAIQEQQRLHIAYEQQRQINQLKDQFLLNASHELRTPLTEVFGYLELLRENHGRLDATMETTFLDNALHGCEELQELVGNVLNAVEVSESVKSPILEELSVNQVMRDVLAHFDPRKQQTYTFHLDITDHLMVVADPQYLRQVLRNLLTNACNYSPLSSAVTISAAPGESAGQENAASPFVCICVKDAGQGIPPAEIPLLFGKFVRLKRDLAGPVRGTGLGLYISKELVETMGGRIWIISSGIPGEGSCICFTLPCATTLSASAS